MHLRLLFILFVFLLSTCKSGPNENAGNLPELKKALKANPSQENRNALIDEYRILISQDSTAHTSNAAYYGEMAALQVQNKAFSEAVQSLMDGIKYYPTNSQTPENVWSLGTIYEKNLRNPIVATIIKKLYAKSFPKGENLASAMQTIETDKADIDSNIIKLGSQMYNETTHQVNFQAASDYIRVCELYALLKPTDSKSPDYLHKAAETARAVRSFPKAIVLYDWIYNKYPDYPKRAQALFLKAFTYDNDLGDKKTARTLYESFLKQYPNDDFSDDTAFLLENIGKNDEEIIKGFNKE